jgi:DNA-binding CsgD family transcriptional regulator
VNISRSTATFHLKNAKNKFGVRTVCQAVAHFAAARRTVD